MPLTQIRRAKKTTGQQFDIMLDFLENHPEMISGKITETFTAQRREDLWIELSILLNSVSSGPQKIPLKWKRTWYDIKSETKQKEKELKKVSSLRGNSNHSIPHHIARIRSLLALPNEGSCQNIKESKWNDQCFIKKECFTEETSLDADIMNNGTLELEDKTSISIENVSDILSSTKTHCESMLDISITSVKPPDEQIPDRFSVLGNIQSKENSDTTPMCAKVSSENIFDSSVEPPDKINCNSLPKSPKSPCEEVSNILTMSMKKFHDVIKKSENRTITAFNSLTKATVRANELHERQLQIEEERNKLYQERNEILLTLVNTFRERKLNHQY